MTGNDSPQGSSGRPDPASSATPVEGSDLTTQPGSTDPQGMESLGRLRLQSETVASVLHRVATIIKQLLPVAEETSATLFTGSGQAIAAWTGLVAFELDECQHKLGSGPTLQAADSGQTMLITDTETEDRWPDFTHLALRQGVRSVLVVPVPIDTLAQAALSVYSGQAAVFDPHVISHAERMAAQTAVAIANMHDLDAARAEIVNLQTALASRQGIEQAKGALMAIHGYDADAAFHALSTQSQQTNVKVRNIAAQVLAQVRREDSPATSIGVGYSPPRGQSHHRR